MQRRHVGHLKWTSWLTGAEGLAGTDHLAGNPETRPGSRDGSHEGARIPESPAPQLSQLPTSRTAPKQSHAQNSEATAPRDSTTSVGKISDTSVMTSSQRATETGSRRAGLRVIANPRRGPSRRGQPVAYGGGGCLPVGPSW